MPIRDAVGTPDQLEHIATLLPPEWVDAAYGRGEDCARADRSERVTPFLDGRGVRTVQKG